ncbi:MAG: glycosyltransferase family 4 protein [Neorhizobium sp.]|nr:glycosyltransferase family 4 protein [Neorhizobium sp.]
MTGSPISGAPETVVVDIGDVEVIAPNFKRRLSGVTSTIIQLVPIQHAAGHKVAALGPGLPGRVPHIRFRNLLSLWTPPKGRAHRVWHARRNIEMLPAIVMRDVLRMKVKIAFTSASQRKHSRWTRWLISKMDAVISTSGRTASYMEKRSTVILHGIDTERFAPPADKADAKRARGLASDKKIVGCFGRVRHQKGTDLFVDAMIRALPAKPDWIAIIAGRATGKHQEFETGLKQKVSAAGLSDRILFVGEHTDIDDWYRALDLFIAPQRWEGFGLTPLEAMATGVPVIATDVGAFPELVVSGMHGTGCIIPRDDLDAMVEAAEMFMDDARLLAGTATHALAHARKNFAIANEVTALKRVYDRLLSPGD